MLSVEDLNDALTELGRRAQAKGKVLEIAIYGGSALMLASNFRLTTQDVDAVADTDKDQLMRFAAMFYPEARVSGRLRLGLDVLWAARQSRSPRELHAPRYLGRSGTAPKRR